MYIFGSYIITNNTYLARLWQCYFTRWHSTSYYILTVKSPAALGSSWWVTHRLLSLTLLYLPVTTTDTFQPPHLFFELSWLPKSVKSCPNCFRLPKTETTDSHFATSRYCFDHDVRGHPTTYQRIWIPPLWGYLTSTYGDDFLSQSASMGAINTGSL